MSGAFESGTCDIDLLSTHTKYAPSQAEWLSPLDEMMRRDDDADLLPRAAELSRVGRRLLQVPRNLDVRLLHCYHLYVNPETCAVHNRVGLAALPAGPAAIHAGYAGCHSFALAARSQHWTEAAALLRHLTSFDAQVAEARRGAIPCRESALRQVREEASAGSTDARRWDLLSEAEQTMIIPPRFAAYPRCEEAIWHSIQRAMMGEWSPEFAVSTAASEILPIVGVRPAVGS